MAVQEINLVGTITIGGGSTPVLEEITVQSRVGQDQVIVPSEGVDGYNKITVSAVSDRLQDYCDGSYDTITEQNQCVISSNGVKKKICYIPNIPYVQMTGFTEIERYAAQYNNKMKKFSAPNVVEIGGYAFNECAELLSVSLPLCTTITPGAYTEDRVFYNCKKLSSLNMPLLTVVTPNCFYFCQSLASISLPECTTIKNNAFQSCTSLQSLTLPKCTSIASQAFRSCSALTDLYLPGDTMCALSTNVSNIFNGCPINTDENARVHVNASLVETYKQDAYWSIIASKIVAIS